MFREMSFQASHLILEVTEVSHICGGDLGWGIWRSNVEPNWVICSTTHIGGNFSGFVWGRTCAVSCGSAVRKCTIPFTASPLILRICFSYCFKRKIPTLFRISPHNWICQQSLSIWMSVSCTLLSAKKNWHVFAQEGPVLESTGHPGLLICISVLTWRSCVSMGREFGYYWLRLLLSAVLTLCIGTMYFNLGHSVDSVRVRLNNIHHTNLDSACECTCIPSSVPFQW
jgi:hypothetical protein